MQLLSYALPDSHNFFFFSDKHEGSILSSQRGWDKMCHMMASEYEGCGNNYGGDGGDSIEAIMVDDKRYSIEQLTEARPLVQMQDAIRIREPIREQLLYMLDGNHDRHLWRFGDIAWEMCRSLGVDYGTTTAKVTIKSKDGTLMYKVFSTHGFKSITSTADDPKRREVNKQLILKRHLKFKAGDCAVMIKGHTHKLLVCKPETELYLTDDGKKINQNYTKSGQTEDYIHPDARWYGNSGSFLRLYGEGISGYAERFEYDPVEIGFLILRVRDRKIISLDKIYLDI
ncbi:MAG: hypothetical protein KKD44_25780 [Proteobacteria bacterium]|nr:hypothetical protein [Pseudomonadota bacterium]